MKTCEEYRTSTSSKRRYVTSLCSPYRGMFYSKMAELSMRAALESTHSHFLRTKICNIPALSSEELISYSKMAAGNEKSLLHAYFLKTSIRNILVLIFYSKMAYVNARGHLWRVLHEHSLDQNIWMRARGCTTLSKIIPPKRSSESKRSDNDQLPPGVWTIAKQRVEKSIYPEQSKGKCIDIHQETSIINPKVEKLIQGRSRGSLHGVDAWGVGRAFPNFSKNRGTRTYFRKI